jgi:2',3'-cyclic-nucleotide 2'-phosphodiesterase (5'-nucleotidase family)
MNQLGFDFWVPGNGEFYDGLGNLQTRMGEARCKVLCANITVSETGKTVAQPFVIERVGDLRIAFVGLCFIHTAHPSSWVLNYVEPIETARKLVPQLRQQADLVVAITHIGVIEDRKLAAGVPGIDLIIGAHSHTVLPRGQSVRGPDGREVLICQAGEFLQYAGQVDLTVSRSSSAGPWQVTRAVPRLVRLDEKVQIDPSITALIARLAATTREAATPSLAPATR